MNPDPKQPVAAAPTHSAMLTATTPTSACHRILEHRQGQEFGEPSVCQPDANSTGTLCREAAAKDRQRGGCSQLLLCRQHQRQQGLPPDDQPVHMVFEGVEGVSNELISGPRCGPQPKDVLHDGGGTGGSGRTALHRHETSWSCGHPYLWTAISSGLENPAHQHQLERIAAARDGQLLRIRLHDLPSWAC